MELEGELLTPTSVATPTDSNAVICVADRTFKQHKITCLSKVDFSKKGCIDEPIVPLVQYINKCDHYFTTSSCSGRICVFEEVLPE